MRCITAVLLFLSTISLYGQGTRLLRQPTVHGTDVVFVYANDLWKASTNGGDAQRLTSDIGYESVPHFSPDGSMIAFTGEYDGNTDVFVIPEKGGIPEIAITPTKNVNPIIGNDALCCATLKISC